MTNTGKWCAIPFVLNKCFYIFHKILQELILNLHQKYCKQLITNVKHQMTFSNSDTVCREKESCITILLQEFLYPDLPPWHNVTIHMTLTFINSLLVPKNDTILKHFSWTDIHPIPVCLYTQSETIYIGASSLPYITYISPRHTGRFSLCPNYIQWNFADYIQSRS